MRLEKHLLVTVGEDPSAFYGVRFLGGFFSARTKAETRITLFYAAPGPARVWPHEVTHETVRRSGEQSARIETDAREHLDQARELCISQGFAPDMVHKKLIVRASTRIKDILAEGEDGLYDAVVLGRRGLTRLSEFLDESLTRRMMAESYHFPLWICRRPGTGRRDVLVCVDGSQPSLKITDHVGFMLSGDDSHKAVLCQAGRPGDPAIQRNLDLAAATLRENGFAPERISTRILPGDNVAQTLLAEAERGRYAVVAVGQTGAGQATLRKFFFGSVSDTLFRKLEGAVLWVCQ